MSVSKNNTSNQILASNGVFNGLYDDVSTYAQICVSLNTNTKYKLTINYSVNGISVDYSEDINVTSRPTETVFYNFVPKEKYFSLSFQNTDSIQQNTMFLQTIYKNSLTTTGSGVGSNVSIVSPVNGDGYVQVYVKNSDVVVSGSVDIGNFPTTQDVNITNTSIDTNITNTSLDVSVSNFPVTQDVNITNTSIDTNITNTSIDTNITNTSLDVSVSNFPSITEISGETTYNLPDKSVLVCTSNVQTQGSKVWNNVSVSQNETSGPVGVTYQSSSNLTVFGKADGACTIGVQFSDNNDNEYFTSQYQVTLTAIGSFGFCIPAFCAPAARLILLSANPVTITSFMYFS